MHGKKIGVQILSLFMGACLFFSGSALEAAAPSDAIPKMQKNSLYVLGSFPDSQEIAERLARSEFMKAVEEASGVRGVATHLRRLKVKESAFYMELASRSSQPIRFGAAFSFPPEQSALLARIEQGKASGNEILSLLGGSSADIPVRITDPVEDEKRYYIAGSGLELKVSGKILILSNTLDDNLKALTSSASREALPGDVKGNNKVQMLIPETIARRILPISPKKENDSEEESLRFATGIQLLNGGWDVDMRTNAIRYMDNGDEWMQRLRPLGAEALFSVGGARAIGAASWHPNTTYFQHYLEKKFGLLPDAEKPAKQDPLADFFRLLYKGNRATATLQRPDRVSLVVLQDDSFIWGVRPYLAFLGGEDKVAEIARDSFLEYVSTQKGLKSSKVERAGWDYVYEITGPVSKPAVTLASKKGVIFLGLVSSENLDSPALLPEKLDQLARQESLYEFVYKDVASIRAFVWRLLDIEEVGASYLKRGRYRDHMRLMLRFVADIEEVTAETHSPEHIVFQVTTGRPSAEERFRLIGL